MGIATSQITITTQPGVYIPIITPVSVTIPCNSDFTNPIYSLIEIMVELKEDDTFIMPYVDVAQITSNYPITFTATSHGGSTNNPYVILKIKTISENVEHLRFDVNIPIFSDSSFTESQGIQKLVLLKSSASKDGYTPYLSNSNDSVVSDVNGNVSVSDVSKISCDLSAYTGITELLYTTNTSPSKGYFNCSLTPNNCTVSSITIKPSTNNKIATFNLTGWTSASLNKAYVDVLFRLEGKTSMVQRMTISAIPKGQNGADGSDGVDGADGADAKYIIVSGEQTFKYNSLGNPINTNIVLTAKSYGGIKTCSWQYNNGTSWVKINDSTFNSEKTSTYTIAHNSSYFINNLAKLRCYYTDGVNEYFDEITIVKLYDGTNGTNGSNGSNGTNGVNSINVILSNETHSIVCDHLGTPLDKEIGSTGKAKTQVSVYSGTTELQYTDSATPSTNQFTFNIVTQTNVTGVKRPYESSKKYGEVYINSLSASENSGELVLEVKVGGTPTLYSKVFSVTKTKTGQPGEFGPSIVYTGEYSSSKLYKIDNKIRTVVKYTDNNFYMTKLTSEGATSGTFSNIIPTNTDYWLGYGANFESIATGILFAEEAFIGGLNTYGITIGDVGESKGWTLNKSSISSRVTRNNKPLLQLTEGGQLIAQEVEVSGRVQSGTETEHFYVDEGNVGYKTSNGNVPNWFITSEGDATFKSINGGSFNPNKIGPFEVGADGFSIGSIGSDVVDITLTSLSNSDIQGSVLNNDTPTILSNTITEDIESNNDISGYTLYIPEFEVSINNQLNKSGNNYLVLDCELYVKVSFNGIVKVNTKSNFTFAGTDAMRNQAYGATTNSSYLNIPKIGGTVLIEYGLKLQKTKGSGNGTGSSNGSISFIKAVSSKTNAQYSHQGAFMKIGTKEFSLIGGANAAFQAILDDSNNMIVTIKGTLNSQTSVGSGGIYADYLGGIAADKFVYKDTNNIYNFNSTVSLNNTNTSPLLLKYSTTHSAQFGFNTAESTLNIWTDTNHHIRFGTNGNERMRILNSGNVGIGYNNPTVKLDVAGEIRARTSSSYPDLRLGANSTEGYLWGYSNHHLKIGTNGLERIRILNNGYVGIGTSNPRCKLELYDGDFHTDQTRWIRFIDGGSGTFKWGLSGNFNGNFAIYNYIGGKAALSINPSGDTYLAGDVIAYSTNIYNLPTTLNLKNDAEVDETPIEDMITREDVLLEKINLLEQQVYTLSQSLSKLNQLDMSINNEPMFDTYEVDFLKTFCSDNKNTNS